MNHFIINPNAGTNRKSRYLALINLIKSNPANIVWETSLPLEAPTLVQKAIKMGATRIIAVGGDGTINEVASELVGTNIPLGIIPIGSGNGLARHLGIPLHPAMALSFATSGASSKIDVGKFNGKYFFCTAGIGFDASVAHRFAKGSKRGFINYIKATLLTLFNYKPIEVSINNEPFEKVFSLTIANANQFGNNAFISPSSNIQDGQLELIKIKKLNLFQAAVIGVRLFLGNIDKSTMVQVLACKEVTIQYKSKAPFHLDGEYLFTTDSTIHIQLLPLSTQVVF